MWIDQVTHPWGKTSSSSSSSSYDVGRPEEYNVCTRCIRCKLVYRTIIILGGGEGFFGTDFSPKGTYAYIKCPTRLLIYDAKKWKNKKKKGSRFIPVKGRRWRDGEGGWTNLTLSARPRTLDPTGEPGRMNDERFVVGTDYLSSFPRVLEVRTHALRR